MDFGWYTPPLRDHVAHGVRPLRLKGPLGMADRLIIIIILNGIRATPARNRKWASSMSQIGAEPSMEALFVMFKPDGSRADFTIREDRKYTVGRGETCHLRIPLASVSREHATIFFDEEEDELMIEDLGSSNGTFVNRERIDEPMELTPGDVVQIGNVPFQVVIDGYPEDVAPIIETESPNADENAGQSTKEPPSGSDETVSTEDDGNIDSFFGFDLDDEDI